MMFLAMYKWHAKPGREEQFRDAWRRGTAAITARYGSYGSRLCIDPDGSFLGVAELPSEEAWRAAMANGMWYDDEEARRDFAEATSDGGEPVLTLTVLDDLVRRPGS